MKYMLPSIIFVKKCIYTCVPVLLIELVLFQIDVHMYIYVGICTGEKEIFTE